MSEFERITHVIECLTEQERTALAGVLALAEAGLFDGGLHDMDSLTHSIARQYELLHTQQSGLSAPDNGQDSSL